MENTNSSTNNCGPYRGSGRVWVDDRTNVYIGNCKELTSRRAIASQTHPDTKSFRFEAECCDYLYFVCWSNHSGRNAFLAEVNDPGSGNMVVSGSSDWEVFATGKTTALSSAPTLAEINDELKRACSLGWSKLTVGNQNTTDSDNYIPQQSSISSTAHYVWYNSTGAAHPHPFSGFNHDEFLIIRLPLKSLFTDKCRACECEKCICDECKEAAYEIEQANKEHCSELVNELQPCNGEKPKCDCIEDGECIDISQQLSNIKPCISIRWGDSDCDCMETDDFEVMCITVCNCYADITFQNFTITNIEILDQGGNPVPILPNGHPVAAIYPIGPYCFGDIGPCDPKAMSCVSRQFVLKTLGVEPGNYQISLSGICYGIAASAKDSACFTIEICDS